MVQPVRANKSAQVRKKVLVVCRKGSQAEAVVPALREAGFDIEAVDSPFKAVAVHSREPFPAIILDAARLEADEASVFEVLRDGLPNVYILAIVPPNQRDKAVGFLKAGVDQYVMEPLYLEEVTTLLESAFARGQSTDREVSRQEKLRALGQFARGVAHAVNNPLTTLSGWLQLMLADTKQDDPRRKTLLVMSQETDRIAHVVRDLLAFAGHPSPNRTPVDINRLLDRVVMAVEQDGKHRTVLFTRHFTPGLGMVLADEEQLAEAYTTLICFCATRSGAGEDVDIATYPVDDTIHVEISDSGDPLEAEAIERLFDPFASEAVDNWGASEGDLSGLALPVCYGVIRGLGGALNITTEEQRGSSFIIKLPVSAQPELHDRGA